MRRSVLEEAGTLNPDYQLLMDNLLWMCMARQAPIVYTPQTWAAARYHDQAKNRTRGAAYGQEARRLIADLKARPEFSDLIQRDEKHILAGVERFDGFYLTDAGRPQEALQSYGRAFRLYPKMAAQDWKHILLAILSLLGLDKARLWYDHLRARRLHLE
jgi:tetratricopeptide (TPR) repeat protein